MEHDDLIARVLALIDQRDYSVLCEGRHGWFTWYQYAAQGEW